MLLGINYVKKSCCPDYFIARDLYQIVRFVHERAD